LSDLGSQSDRKPLILPENPENWLYDSYSTDYSLQISNQISFRPSVLAGEGTELARASSGW